MATPDNSKNTSRIILVIVGILVLSALAYFGIKYFTEKAENEENLAKIDELNNEMMELEERILDFQATLEDKNMEIADKDKLLEEKERQIQDYIDRLAAASQSGRVKEDRIRQLEARATSLQRMVDQYKLEVEELQAANRELSTQVDTFRTRTTRLEREKSDLKATNEATTQKLEETVKIASVLKAREFQFALIKNNGKEKEDTEFPRWRLDEISICFNLQENLIADPGPRELYVVIESPDGTPNTNPALSGEFEHEGQMRPYSVMTTVDFDRLAQEVCVEYKPKDKEKFEKGPQYVSVYTEGNLIGQSAFRVK